MIPSIKRNVVGVRWAILLFSVQCSIVSAQWQPNGVAVCDTLPNASIFTFPRITSDGLSGAFVCWRDVRKGDLDVYAQRIDGNGRTMWQANGIPIAQGTGSQDFPRIASDAKGNAFIAWEDGRVTNVFPYVQRVTREGQVLWQTNGVKVAEIPGIFISIAADGRGGCVLAWTNADDVFAQRIDSMGQRLWGDNGVQLTNRPEVIYPGDVAVVSEKTGGAIIVWSEGDFGFERVYAQKVDSVGTVRWVGNGVPVSDTSHNISVAVCSDSQGRVIITWADESKSLKFAQKIDLFGNALWGSNGISLSGIGGGGGGEFRTISNGKGGAFVGHSKRIQNLDSTGNKLWDENGVLFITAETGSTNSAQVFDGKAGVFNFTEFFKNGEGWFILAQWIDGTGTPGFGPDGMRLTPGIVDGRQFWPVSISDGKGAAIVCWNDNRSNSSAIYIARIDTSGIITKAPLPERIIPQALDLQQNYPNPFNPKTIIKYEIPAPALVQLIIYDSLGKEIIKLVDRNQAGGAYSVLWDGSNNFGERVASGVYYYKIIVDNRHQVTKKSILLK